MTNNYFKVSYRNGAGKILSNTFCFNSHNLGDIEDAYDSARATLKKCAGRGRISVYEYPTHHHGPWQFISRIGDDSTFTAKA